MENIIIFRSHTHVEPFAKVELMLSDIIKKTNLKPILLHPSYCSCRNSRSSFQRNECYQCTANAKFLKLTSGASDFLKIKMSEYDIRYKEISVKEQSDLVNTKFKNINIGNIALHDILLKHKISSLDFTANEKAKREYIDLLVKCLLVANKLESYLNNKKVRSLLVYNSNYSLNRLALEICQSMSISNYSVHGSFSLGETWSSLMISSGGLENYYPACEANWKKTFHSKRLSKQSVLELFSHFQELFRGKNSHAYSAPVGGGSLDNIIAKVNPNGDRKVLLACTSSPDELFALEQSGILNHNKNDFLFESQLEWIKFLINKVTNDSTKSLIIRVHPREFPNKREGVTSENAIKLKCLLKELPCNIAVNWPSDNISFYELMLNTDLVLTCWSSVLLEASCFGCPIVLPKNPVTMYQVIADAISESNTQYWDDICSNISKSWEIERSTKSLRWMWLIQKGGTVSIAGGKNRKAYLSERIFLLISLIYKKYLKNRIIQKTFVADAYYGRYKELVERGTNVAGESIIAEILLNKLNPTKDFTRLNQTNNVLEESCTYMNERDLVQSLINEMTKIILKK